MPEQYRTIKIRFETYRALKVLAAESGEKLVELIERLAREERARKQVQTDPAGAHRPE